MKKRAAEATRLFRDLVTLCYEVTDEFVYTFEETEYRERAEEKENPIGDERVCVHPTVEYRAHDAGVNPREKKQSKHTIHRPFYSYCIMR